MQNPGSVLLLLVAVVAVYAENNVTLTMKGPDRALFVGESFGLEVCLKRCGVAESVLPIFVEPQLEHLWIKKAGKVRHSKEDGCMLSRKRYRLSPQQSGSLLISPAEVQVGYDQTGHDAWGNLREKRHWQSYYSNAVDIYAAPLPEGTTLVGEFTLSLDVEGSEVGAGKPLYGEVVVEGEGNFEDLSIVLPTIHGADLFADEPELIQVGSGNGESWRQKLTFVGVHDFTIDPVTLRYFDPKEAAVKEVMTEAVMIHVVGGNDVLKSYGRGAEAVSKREESVVWYAAAGVLLGALLLLLLLRKNLRGLLKRTKVSCRDHKGVLRLLLAHREDDGVAPIIEALENHIYGGEKRTIDQKEVKKLLDRYQ